VVQTKDEPLMIVNGSEITKPMPPRCSEPSTI
jgi:hypothetical protein